MVMATGPVKTRAELQPAASSNVLLFLDLLAHFILKTECQNWDSRKIWDVGLKYKYKPKDNVTKYI